MDSSVKSFLLGVRASANSFLSGYEPLVLVFTPLVGLFVASTLQSVIGVLQEKGVKATLLGFFMSFIKLVPGVKNYIDAEKQKVVEKLQSGGKSKKENWRTELPSTGLGVGILDQMKDEKRKDVAWQGKCSAILEEVNLKGIFV